MPQLDKVTFLSQFFWLCVFYLGFYIVILKYFLPKLSRILKFRKKKISLSQQGVSSMEQEKERVRDSLETLIGRGVVASKTVFQENLQHTQGWLEKIVTDTHRTQWNKTNQIYISSLGEKSISQNLPLELSFLNVSEKILAFLLTNKLRAYPAFFQQKNSQFTFQSKKIQTSEQPSSDKDSTADKKHKRK